MLVDRQRGNFKRALSNILWQRWKFFDILGWIKTARYSMIIIVAERICHLTKALFGIIVRIDKFVLE